MSRSIKAALALAIAALACGAAAAPPNLPGRPATAQEVAAWDIDVRPDFTGLPKGSGSVLAGQAVWEGKCASCHGTFGESNEVFTPLIGGTTAADAANGRVASLVNGRQPQKTTLMKLATVSTLWDYINRAMPWTAPKSLTTDEVYAVTAYMLNMGEVVPDDFVLSDRTIAQAQQRMPNRKGMVTNHGLWDIKGKPDVRSVACMTNCPVEATVRSSLPEAARNAHGNLAQQTRGFGATRGVDTTQAAPTARLAAVAPAAASGPDKGAPGAAPAARLHGLPRDRYQGHRSQLQGGARKIPGRQRGPPPGWRTRSGRAAPAPGARYRCRRRGRSGMPIWPPCWPGFWQHPDQGTWPAATRIG